MYQCRLLWQYRKIQEENKYVGSVCYAIYQHYLSTIDHLDYNPSMHVENDLKPHAKLAIADIR